MVQHIHVGCVYRGKFGGEHNIIDREPNGAIVKGRDNVHVYKHRISRMLNVTESLMACMSKSRREIRR